MELYGEDVFIERVAYALSGDKPVTWIVGSPLSYDGSLRVGVPAVREMVQLIRAEFADSETASKLDAQLVAASNEYQAAFSFLTAYKGQQAANDVVRRAVLAAYRGQQPLSLIDDDLLRAAERDAGNWSLPAAALALGKVIQNRSGRSRTGAITTNFDPLIEIAIRQAGGQPVTSSFHRDGNPASVLTEQPHVVHLHGYWLGSDTLHAPHQLTQDRPKLKDALAAALRSSVIVVVGYSGWDDVVTSVLAEVLDEDMSYPEVIWGFNESDISKVSQKYDKVLGLLRPGLARNRVTCYGGIDVHRALPGIRERYRERSSAPRPVEPLVKEVPRQPSRLRTSDSIPTVDRFVGRDKELAALHSVSASVISISGLGGQGKSILAARFLQDHSALGRGQPSFVVDWRDCKEEGNTAHLSLCLFIEAATRGRLRAEALSRCSVDELALFFAEVAEQCAGVLVLDNIDTYIDVENSSPTGIVGSIVKRHLTSASALRIVLTSRPELRLSHSKFFSLHIDGLEAQATRALYTHKSSAELSEKELDRLLTLTRGHPLGVVLLAAQRLSSSRTLDEILDDLASSKSDLARDILRGSYRLLKSEDQGILRSLAELEKPEFETELDEITGVRFNRLTRSLKRLRDMNLVLTRVDRAGKHLIDLHPLVRQFIRHEYHQSERETFIGRILVFFDKKLTPIRTQLAGEISSYSLGTWLHKIEILVNRGSWIEAVQELSLLANQLEKHGLIEEKIRLGEKVLLNADWKALVEQGKHYRKWMSSLMSSMTYFGLHGEVERWLQVYESYTTKGGADSIVISAARAFDAWFRKDFDRALYLSAEAKARFATVDVDIENDPAHIYALALRDSGEAEEALPELLQGLSVEDALAGESGKPGSYYGNVGRCFQLTGRIDEALKAYQLCFKDFHQSNDVSANAGWLRQWVGECFDAKAELEKALDCYVAAEDIWKSTSPALRRIASESIAKITSRRAMNVPPAWKAEGEFERWGKA